MAKYKVNKRTNILKENPNKKDMFGDVGTDVVGTLEAGQIIEIANVGRGGRGVIATPYLFFADGTYIIGYDADKYVSPFGDISEIISSIPKYTNGELKDKDLDAKNQELALKQQIALSQQNNLTSTQKTDVAPQTFLEKNKTNLLIVGALVLGYLAYKKFNK